MRRLRRCTTDQERDTGIPTHSQYDSIAGSIKQLAHWVPTHTTVIKTGKEIIKNKFLFAVTAWQEAQAS